MSLGSCEVVDGIEQAWHCPALREYVTYEGITLYGRAKAALNRAQRR